MYSPHTAHYNIILRRLLDAKTPTDIAAGRQSIDSYSKGTCEGVNRLTSICDCQERLITAKEKVTHALNINIHERI